MSRCGCETVSGCQCFVSPGDGINVSGAGSSADPFVVAVALSGDGGQTAEFSSGDLLVDGSGTRDTLGTVSVAQSGARASAFTEASYRIAMDEVYATLIGTISAAGSAGNVITVTAAALPTPKYISGVVGIFRYTRAAGAGTYVGIVSMAAGGVLTLFDGSGVSGIGLTPSFATASTDAVEISLHYPALV